MAKPPSTPPPWAFHDRLCVLGSDSNVVCECPNNMLGYSEQWKADARIIAAAPDLLEALGALVEEVCDYATTNNLGDPEAKRNIKLARAALAKASVPDPTVLNEKDS
jgi:hypothetical protein